MEYKDLAKGKIYSTCEGDSEKNPEKMPKNLVNSQSKKCSIVQQSAYTWEVHIPQQQEV